MYISRSSRPNGTNWQVKTGTAWLNYSDDINEKMCTAYNAGTRLFRVQVKAKKGKIVDCRIDFQRMIQFTMTSKVARKIRPPLLFAPVRDMSPAPNTTGGIVKKSPRKSEAKKRVSKPSTQHRKSHCNEDRRRNTEPESPDSSPNMSSCTERVSMPNRLNSQNHRASFARRLRRMGNSKSTPPVRVSLPVASKSLAARVSAALNRASHGLLGTPGKKNSDKTDGTTLSVLRASNKSDCTSSHARWTRHELEPRDAKFARGFPDANSLGKTMVGPMDVLDQREPGKWATFADHPVADFNCSFARSKNSIFE